MNKNNGLTDGERLVCLETKVDAIIETQNATNADLKALVKTVNDLLPTYATKIELSKHSDINDERMDNLKKANKLQNILTNMLISFFSVIITALLMFWFNNK